MKAIYSLAFFSILLSCSGDPATPFPISYTFDHSEQNDEGLYLVGPSNSFSSLPANTGSYGAIREEFRQEILEGLHVIFDLKEIRLLNEDSVRVNYISDDIEYDTIVSYTSIENEIDIDALDGGIVTYDKSNDQFILCSVTTFALAGPNVTMPDQVYNMYSLTECTPDFDNMDYAARMLTRFDFQPLDTLGVLLTKMYYK